jgi:hypothetical protein
MSNLFVLLPVPILIIFQSLHTRDFYLQFFWKTNQHYGLINIMN